MKNTNEEEDNQLVMASPFSLIIAKDEFDSSLPLRLSANGSNAEIYLPRIETKDPIALSNCKLMGIVTWPDNSRTAYFQPTGPGVYSIGVSGVNATITSGDNEDDTITDLLLKEVERALDLRPTASSLAKNAVTNARGAEIAKNAFDTFVGDAIEKIKEFVQLPL